MLRKQEPIDVPKEDPFRSDKLDREKSAENLTRLVKAAEQPFVLSVEAPWGWGKTTFLKMWKAHLENAHDPGFFCVYYNAWKSDFVEDPLVAFLGELKQQLKETSGDQTENDRQVSVEGLEEAGATVLKKGLPLAIQALTLGALTREDIEDVVAELKEKMEDEGRSFLSNRISEYQEERRAIRAFRSELSSVAQQVGPRTPMVVFVDELDRCRPNYAVAFLERTKHLFAAEDVFFALGVDRGQLESSIRSLYGEGIDAGGYLRRFVDLRYRLPRPETQEFCEFLADRFGLQDASIDDPQQSTKTIASCFAKVATIFDLSLRSQEQCFTEINVILNATPDGWWARAPLLAYLVALKARRPRVFRSIANKDATIGEALEPLKESQAGDDFLGETHWGAYIEVGLRFHLQSRSEIKQYSKEMDDKSRDGTLTDEKRQWAGHRARFIKHFEGPRRGSLGRSPSMEELVDWVDMARQFR